MTVTPVDPSSGIAERDPGTEPRLVVPEGMVIDECARERLARGLARAPSSVAGIVAETAALAPGASYRVEAEWSSLEPAPSASTAAGTLGRGAVMLRPNIDFEVHDGVVEIAHGALLVDPGAHVHDPHRPIGALEVASERGRPPFPRRPVVVFLGCEAEGLADWVRRLANRLVRRDIEARLAVPDVAEGLHLTRPCLPGEGSVRALAPDVVVTLDDAATAQVDAWCAGDRSTVVVELDRQMSAPVELVSWQIERAAGRLRARIGPRVDASMLAALVVRLCAGPHPIAPSDPVESVEPVDARGPVRERATGRVSAASTPDCVVVAGANDRFTAARVEGLVENLAAANFPVTLAPVAVLPPAARSAALVLLAGVAPAPAVDELIAERRAAGLPTVVDLGRADVERTTTGSDAQPRLTEPAAALGAACGLVVSPVGAAFGAARRSGLRALLLPSLLSPTRVEALRDARARFDPTPPFVVGWHVGVAGSPWPDYGDVVADAVAESLTRHPEAQIELVGDSARVPSSLRGPHPLTVVPDGAVDPELLARWAVHVWAPMLIGDEVADDARVFEEASCAGVPSILAAPALGVVDGFVSPALVVQSAENARDWIAALHHVLNDASRRAIRAGEAARRADAVDGLAAAKTIVSRFVGWARYEAGA